MEQDALCAGFDDGIHVLGFEHRFAVEDNLVTLDGYHFAGIFVHEVFHPALQHTSSQLTSNDFLQIGLGNLHFFGQFEYLKDVFVRFKTNGAQEGRNGQLLLTVNVCVHHIVDVRGKLNPGALKGNDTGRIELGTIGMDAGPKEHARRAVKLRHHHTLGTIDDKGTVIRHIRYRTQEYVLHYGVEVLVVGVCAVKFKLCL